MLDDVKLFCFVQGDRPSQIFNLPFRRGDTVSNLKQTIHARKSKLQHIDIDDLEIYKVTLLIWCDWMLHSDVLQIDNLKISCETFNKADADVIVIQDNQELAGGRRVAKIWEKNPDPDLLHVLVRRPDGEWQSVHPKHYRSYDRLSRHASVQLRELCCLSN